MNWNEYKEHVKQTDPVGKEILEEAEAASISAIIKQRTVHEAEKLSQKNQ
ncbi:MAG: hypothetical protein IJV46_00335 [Acidaminococcaceae bacterium]|nr:hypothetical protein [Acidaminococcaceae bacterium]